MDSGGSQASFLMQAFTLTRRSFINMSRDVGYYWLRLVIYILLTICIGTIYFRIGSSYDSILVRDLFIFILLIMLDQQKLFCLVFFFLAYYSLNLCLNYARQEELVLPSFLASLPLCPLGAFPRLLKI